MLELFAVGEGAAQAVAGVAEFIGPPEELNAGIVAEQVVSEGGIAHELGEFAGVEDLWLVDRRSAGAAPDLFSVVSEDDLRAVAGKSQALVVGTFLDLYELVYFVVSQDSPFEADTHDAVEVGLATLCALHALDDRARFGVNG